MGLAAGATAFAITASFFAFGLLAFSLLALGLLAGLVLVGSGARLRVHPGTLTALEVDARIEMARHWGRIRDFLVALFRYQGIDADSIVEACGRVLSETALEDLQVSPALLERLACPVGVRLGAGLRKSCLHRQ